MFKKSYYLLLSLMASGIIIISNLASNTLSLACHGEPDCPDELLK